VPLDGDGGVKVLSEKTGNDNKVQNDRLGRESIPANIGNLSDKVLVSTQGACGEPPFMIGAVAD
jgi:hypothetical protein